MHRGISGPYFQALLYVLSGSTNFILKETPSFLGDTNKVAGSLTGG